MGTFLVRTPSLMNSHLPVLLLLTFALGGLCIGRYPSICRMEQWRASRFIAEPPWPAQTRKTWFAVSSLRRNQQCPTAVRRVGAAKTTPRGVLGGVLYRTWAPVCGSL